MNTLNLQELNITNNAGQVVGSLTGEADGMRVNFLDVENSGEVIGSIFSNAEGCFVQLHSANGDTLEIDARGLMAFIKGQDAPTWQFPAPKARKAKV